MPHRDDAGNGDWGAAVKDLPHDFDAANLCTWCSKHRNQQATDNEPCRTRTLGEPARRALEAVGMEFMSYELNKDMGFALARDKLCSEMGRRIYWPEIEAILTLKGELQ